MDTKQQDTNDAAHYYDSREQDGAFYGIIYHYSEESREVIDIRTSLYESEDEALETAWECGIVEYGIEPEME